MRSRGEIVIVVLFTTVMAEIVKITPADQREDGENFTQDNSGGNAKDISKMMEINMTIGDNPDNEFSNDYSPDKPNDRIYLEMESSADESLPKPEPYTGRVQ